MNHSLPQPATANEDDTSKVIVNDRTEYRIVCWGNSWFDLVLIPFQTILLYGFMTGFSVLIVQGTYMTSDAQAALWVYFFAWAAGVVYLGVTITVAGWEMRLKAKVAAKVAADEDELA
ncbi:hypothetical protein SDRG_00419 [Saprolegnia diclina VS20]|uniref:Uncharacterized protein n=1 Tax=Saprolegnia diclina (strain VS20) TaxID=1156394 RepID=T0SIE0_SAPDV|nr:hypothetical protein SDRG_00419 [Saprolegnia diclina VS20]EQC42692.1 hypothetical protein SDRG_00419 [Saprolegnia diclina VS20]|eukprot:XP_008604115.1 hypothetical protein SDRG_00419 [Saprolegnia diclina VS20]